MPLDSGGEILLEAVTAAPAEGPVPAGRLGDTVRELPRTLSDAMAPVRDMARTVLDGLRQAGPDEVEVEFGVDLSAETGVVIAKSQTGFHLKVRVLWQREDQPVAPSAGADADAGEGSGSDAGGGTEEGAGADARIASR
ncbi:MULTISPECIES: CU044_2847 family protein [Streptomyces]|uniref:CU044_2847 family protein n=1 Tax=Streptomyces sp. R02 TaxID=3238623 RepID=A0AB39LUZ3_9ACTN